MGRMTLAIGLLGVLVLGAGAADAAEKTLQNDDFASNPGTSVASAQVSTGEGYAVRFVPAPGDYPVTLKKIQFLMVDDPGFPGTECSMFSLKVYKEKEPAELDPESPPLLDTGAADITYDIQAYSDGLQEINLSEYPPIILDSGSFRVELHAEGLGCFEGGGNHHYPVMYPDNGITPGRNFIWGTMPPEVIVPQWWSAESMGIGGDWVMRAVVDATTVCQPDCDQIECGPDGCGGSCGECACGETCSVGQCVDTGCDLAECGDDGCGGSCGECEAGFACEGGICVCQPDCESVACGDDGCGGECGPCADGSHCEEGLCEPDAQPDVVEPQPEVTDDTVEEDAAQDDTAVDDASDDAGGTGDGAAETDPAALTIDKVVPGRGTNDEQIDIMVMGGGFEKGLTAKLDADDLIVVQSSVTDSAFEARVPAGLTAGTKTLMVQNPDGANAWLDEAYVVEDPEITVGASTGGCAVGPHGPTPLATLLLLAAGTLIAGRRRAS